MSGGHYEYKSFQVREFAEELETKGIPYRERFKLLMHLVGDACHSIEWEDSGDWGEKKTKEAIKQVFDFLETEKQNADTEVR